jgi:hypothetical protein
MYKLLKEGMVLRIKDKAVIPADPQNMDYAEYIEWLKVGHTPIEADDEIIVPDYITNREKEYPSMGEVFEALLENMEGRPEKLQKVLAKRKFVQEKYPKPLSLLQGGR